MEDIESEDEENKKKGRTRWLRDTAPFSAQESREFAPRKTSEKLGKEARAWE